MIDVELELFLDVVGAVRELQVCGIGFVVVFFLLCERLDCMLVRVGLVFVVTVVGDEVEYGKFVLDMFLVAVVRLVVLLEWCVVVEDLVFGVVVGRVVGMFMFGVWCVDHVDFLAVDVIVLEIMARVIFVLLA